MTVALVRYDAAERKAWILAARASFRPGSTQPCAVCDKYKSLAHAHHIVPLAIQYGLGYRTPDHTHLWLCPTHHSAVHALISQFMAKRDVAGSTVIDLLNEIEGEELTAVLEAFEMFKEAIA